MHNWIELDLDRLGANIRLLRAALHPGTDILFVVKADAYGHGLEPVARGAWAHGVKRFCVARIEEARHLRSVLPESHILLVGVLTPEDAVEAARMGVEAVVVGEAHGRELARATASGGGVLAVHLKTDTGMGRLGMRDAKAGAVAAALNGLPGLKLAGICTHLAAAGQEDDTFSREQVDRFSAAAGACDQVCGGRLMRHVANSAGVLRSAGWEFDGVRVGLLLYGYPGGAPAGKGRRSLLEVRPILQWKTRLLHVKDMAPGSSVSYDRTHRIRHRTRVGVIDVGYADGYSRHLSNRGAVLVGGRRCPVLGRVTMSLVMVDLGPEASDSEWSEVVLIGRQGSEEIWADEVAGWAGTIPYEVLTSIRPSARLLKRSE